MCERQKIFITIDAEVHIDLHINFQPCGIYLMYCLYWPIHNFVS